MAGDSGRLLVVDLLVEVALDEPGDFVALILSCEPATKPHSAIPLGIPWWETVHPQRVAHSVAAAVQATHHRSLGNIENRRCLRVRQPGHVDEL
jgi:hypothetical protein